MFAARLEEKGDFLEGLGGLEFSSAAAPSGGLSVWVDASDVSEALSHLEVLGASGLLTFEEESTDWVGESAALRRAVLVDRYLFDPHDGRARDGAAARRPDGCTCLQCGPSARVRTSPRALRCGCSSPRASRGARVLDVGCGTGTLAFVASLEGAARVVAFDLDREAAFATTRAGPRECGPARLGLRGAAGGPVGVRAVRRDRRKHDPRGGRSASPRAARAPGAGREAPLFGAARGERRAMGRFASEGRLPAGLFCSGKRMVRERVDSFE